MSAAIVS
jgi:hypothetical protein